MLARAAGVARHHALRTAARMVVVLVVAAYPFWANPARVNADPTPAPLGFALDFTDKVKFQKNCTTAGDARLRDGYLVVGAGGHVECPGSTQQYGLYEFDALAPAGTTSTFELRSPDRAPSRLQLLTAGGVERVRLVNGDDNETQDWTFTFSDKIHRYRIELAPPGLTIFVDECPRLHDAKVSPATRTFGIIATGGDSPLRVNSLRVSSFDTGVGWNPTKPTTCQSAVPATVSHHGRTWWWIGGVVVVVAGVTAIVIAIRRRDPRKLRPGHRK